MIRQHTASLAGAAAEPGGRRDLVRLGRRFVLMLGGEVLQSVFHFGLNIALVHALVPHDYGLFAIVFLIGGIALTFVRAVAGMPASVFIPQARGARAMRAQAVTFGSGAALLSLAMGLGTALVLAIPLGAATAAAGGAFVGLWCLRSYLRNMLFACRRPGIAGISDATFAGTGTVLLACLLAGGRADLVLPGSLAVLAAAHGIAILAGLAAFREPVRISLGRHVLRRYRGLWRSLAWSVAGVATANIQAQGQTLLVALLAGPAAYAPIAATLVLFSPLRLSASVVVNLMQPEMAASLARGDGARLRHLMALSTGLLLAGCLGYGVFLAATLRLIESQLFAGRFSGEPLGLIALLVWATVTATMLYVGPKTLLETRGEFRALARVALASAAFGIGLVGLLLWLATPAWSLLGVVASELVVLLYCRRAILSAAALPPVRSGDGPLHPATAPSWR
ncbi:hypothetical protein [Methylobacterium sp. Leaf399]|uniref:hypothetical protein n=1 Tax=Methylobacterium sp. Leaf399 TaxID=1736364 RepID=UPI000AC173A2|nr:hypothetical protein [Methylobacterium sp. Leaf399]